MNSYPRVVIAGSKSGAGKTTVTIGLMAALNKRIRVQPFKVGPDYIDPAYHAFITGRKSRNLDGWLLEEDVLRYLFLKNMAMADCAVIEGVMGLYDGVGSADLNSAGSGSTAQVAKTLQAPVILVVDASGMGASAAALVLGYRQFDPSLKLAGVIFNRVSGEKHYRILADAVFRHAGVRSFGYLSKDLEVELPSRHLGLVPSVEIESLSAKTEKLSSRLEKTVAVDEILHLAYDWPEPVPQSAFAIKSISGVKNSPPVKGLPIGVAYDDAFNFYYWDNLDLLEEMGAQLIFFSPLRDRKVPDGLAGLMLGGGFPEVFAADLTKNQDMKDSLYKSLSDGMPYIAECGGLMYLLESLEDFQGIRYPMVAWLPGMSRMTRYLQRFGYARMELKADCVWGMQGESIRVHNFHHSVTVGTTLPEAFILTRPSGHGREEETWAGGYVKGAGAAGYPHLHFYSNTNFARNFLLAAAQYAKTEGSRCGA